ncbi:hypothetical protein ILUMI_25095 [Ignelater luminosus]|uniref:Major facilitator superfamily (MFS) profile domain-containing protein n=1 Tax=Ignelater luminosus TaxID=2038154 RepID=A0A8K0C7Y3_IGNLU|nr:hypothetical protein ILUMI_25095 [Ignelater luminosus]
MISSAFIWGYLADTIGRKKLLVIGYLLDGFFVLLCGFSQHYTMLVVSKYMTGFIINGPFAALMSYVNEFHSAKYRAFIPLLNGLIHSIASIILPSLGWLIFSDKITISLFDGFIVLRSWNIFLLVCSLPSLIAGFAYMALPESPKFLMTTGKNERALEILKKVYSFNSGKPPDTYPIKILLDETRLHENDQHAHGGHVTANRTKLQALKEGWQQIIPLFYPPYVSKILIVFTIQFGIMMGLNTLRLWLPQLFTAINDYQTFHKDDKDGNICKMLEMVNPVKTANQTCSVNYNNDPVYTNNIIVALVTMSVYLTAAAIIRKVGKKIVLFLTAFISGICGLCLYFAMNEAVVIALSSVYTGSSGVTANVIVSIVVDIFPTTLRTMTVALTMMFGRTGAMIGNLIFPLLLTAGCLPPFLMVGCLAIGSTLFSIALPKTDMKALE